MCYGLHEWRKCTFTFFTQYLHRMPLSLRGNPGDDLTSLKKELAALRQMHDARSVHKVLKQALLPLQPRNEGSSMPMSVLLIPTSPASRVFRSWETRPPREALQFLSLGAFPVTLSTFIYTLCMRCPLLLLFSCKCYHSFPSRHLSFTPFRDQKGNPKPLPITFVTTNFWSGRARGFDPPLILTCFWLRCFRFTFSSTVALLSHLFHPRLNPSPLFRTDWKVFNLAIARSFGAAGRVSPLAGPDLFRPWIWYLGA